MFVKKKPYINVPSQYYISLDFEYTQFGDIPSEVVEYFYIVILYKVALILDFVFSSEKIFANISYELNEEYQKLTWLLKLIQNRKDIEIRPSEIRPFRSLHTDFKEKSLQWNGPKNPKAPELKGIRELFYTDVALMAKVHGNPTAPYKYQLPLDIEKCFREIGEMLGEFKKEQDAYQKELHPYEWNKTTGTITYKKLSLVFKTPSKIHSIYALLEEKYGKLTTFEELNVLSGSRNQTTKNISDIRKRLKTSKLSKYLVIDSSGKGGYILKLK